MDWLFKDIQQDSMTHVCEYCGSSFTLRWNLNKHRRTAKYCLELQGKEPVEKRYPCDYCSKEFGRRDMLNRHLKTCREKDQALQLASAVNKAQKDQFEVQNTQLLTLITQLQQSIMALQYGTINRNNVTLQNL